VILIILCLAGCKESNNQIPHSISYVAQAFHPDLLCEKTPIHPLCIITSLHDKSPQPVRIEDLQLNLPDYYDVKDYTFSYDLEKKECGGSWKELIEEDFAPRTYASYLYKGSYYNKHVLQTKEHHYGSRYDSDNLILVVRAKDTIHCVADIYQGNFDCIILENNVLQFNALLPAGCIDSIIPRESITNLENEILYIDNNLSESHNATKFGCFYEVDLDDHLLKPKLCGISFLEKAHYSWGDGNEQEKCFCGIVLQYIETGYQKLDLAQTKSFAKEVWESIAEKTAHNESEEK